MLKKALTVAVASALGIMNINGVMAAPRVSSVEFIGMAPPSTPAQKADIYTNAQVKVTYRNGRVKTYDLKYHRLMATGDEINGKLVGGLYNDSDAPILDTVGAQVNSDAPDSNSLIDVPGLKPANRKSSRPLALVTHYEYRGVTGNLPPLDPDQDYWSRLPATMSLAMIDQNKKSGALAVTDYDNISFADDYGLWIPCAGSLTPWNTHLGSEEYEPDAKTREGIPAAGDTGDDTDINSFSSYFFGSAGTANAYRYGLVPEVKVQNKGTANVTMHYAMGRIARELADVQPDGRTVYMGDDGGYTGLFMFVADRTNDLSEGTLYAGKWNQISADGTDGGKAKLSWIRLGHASDAGIKALVDGGIKFSDIFDVSNTDPGDASYTMVHTYMGTEWLRLKNGKETAAAFLETRRYAALLGATTEFNKFEGVTHNAADSKVYAVMSRVEKGMSDGVGDIRLATNKGGAVYELSLSAKVSDSDGALIKSRYVATKMAAIPELLGSYITDTSVNPGADWGDRCLQTTVCDGDNLKYSEAMRTLFIGEDTGYRNNNYVWAFNVDTRKLSRILSVPQGAEATGLQAVDNYNGFAYIMGNFQHPGEFGDAPTSTEEDAVKAELLKNWGIDGYLLRTTIGYIGTEDGAIPAMK